MRMMHVYVKIYPSVENPNMKLVPLHLLPQLVASIVFISFGVVAAFCCAIVDGVFAARHIVSITKAYLTYPVNLDLERASYWAPGYIRRILDVLLTSFRLG